LAFVRSEEEGRAHEPHGEKRGSSKPERERHPRTGHGPREQLELAVTEREHLLDEADHVCPSCGGHLEEMAGQTEDSEEIDVLERQFVLVRHKRKKYRCTTARAPSAAPKSPPCSTAWSRAPSPLASNRTATSARRLVTRSVASASRCPTNTLRLESDDAQSDAAGKTGLGEDVRRSNLLRASILRQRTASSERGAPFALVETGHARPVEREPRGEAYASACCAGEVSERVRIRTAPPFGVERLMRAAPVGFTE
jgi:transposase